MFTKGTANFKEGGGVFFFDSKKRVYATKASNLRSGGTFGSYPTGFVPFFIFLVFLRAC